MVVQRFAVIQFVGMLAQVNHMLAKRELRCFANWKCCADCIDTDIAV